jgi:NAD(P)H dehydrogenase (quinone)
MNILITGANGILGSSIIKQLLTQIPANQIFALVRKPESQTKLESLGVKAFLGDYGDVLSLEKAMEGVDTVLLISSGDQGDRMQEHKNVVDTTKKMGVKSIAYTSRSLRDRSTLANKLMVEHFDTEDYIKASGLKYTIFRNILYMDVIPQFIGGKAALEAGIFLPAGDGKVAYALRSEMGEAIANVLLNEESENKTYNFTGDKLYSFDDIATALTELSGKVVNYNNVEVEVFAAMMKQRNLPEPAIKKIVDFITDIKNNQETEISSDLELKLGRKPTELKEGLKELFEL